MTDSDTSCSPEIPPVRGTAATSSYLDSAATTPLHPTVIDAMSEACRASGANPASQHRPGQAARRLVEDARESIGRILGAEVDSVRPDQVIFTSGGTEANNLALFGLAGIPPATILVSSIEHPSVSGAADELARRGFTVRRLEVSADGVVDLARLAERLASPVRLASLMAVNNETGVIQPIAEAAALCARAGVPLHVDAVQRVGKLPVHFRDEGVAALTVAPHKFHGPVGIGALVVRAGLTLQPQLFGGFQQLGLRPGTESVMLAAGFRRAIELGRDDTGRAERLAAVRDAFEIQIRASWPETVVLGDPRRRAPHIANLAFPGFDRQELLVAFDMAGIACSTGSACASGSSEPSPVHRAMGLPQAIVSSALRFSFHAYQTVADATLAADRILMTLNDLRNRRRPRQSAPGSL